MSCNAVGQHVEGHHLLDQGLLGMCHKDRAVRPSLSPIPVSGPFDRVGVDIIQFLCTKLGNRYAIIFMDYLPELFTAPDQSSATVAGMLNC